MRPREIFINQQNRDGTGAVLAFEWAKAFEANGFKVYATIVDTTTNRDDWINYFPEDKLFIIKDYGNKNKIDFLLKTLRLVLLDQWRIRLKFRKHNFDFSFRPLYGHWNPIVEKCISRNKLVSICHDPISHSGEKGYYAREARNSVLESDEIVVLTETFRQIVSDNYGIPLNKIHYVPHGRMSIYLEKQDSRYKIDYSDKKFNFVFFGRIEEYKGLHVLASALHIIGSKREDFTLTIAGNGDFSDYEEEFSKIKSVKIINRFIPDEEVGCLFDGPNVITVIPYIDATQSGVIPIAYEYTSPIIASDTGGLKEQLNHGKIGLLFKAGDARDLAEKMEYLMDNPFEFDHQAKLINEYRESLNWNIVAKKLVEQLYENSVY